MAVSPLKAGTRHPLGGKSPDPSVGLRFQVKIGDEPIGWFSECSGLGVEYEVTEWPEGGENRFVHKFRGRAKHPNLILKRGITHEKALAKWFNDCTAGDKKTTRKSVIVELLAGDMQKIRTFAFADALPVKWTGPTLNAGQGGVAVETLEIIHHGLAER